MTNSWSYSMFSTAVQCLQKYKLCYIDKIDPDYRSGDMAFGSALHKALEAMIKGDNDAHAIFSIYWDAEQDHPVSYGRFKWGDLDSLGRDFLRKFSKMHLKKYELEQAEVRLYAEYSGVKLEGTLDFYGKYNGRRSLRDFKTSAYNYPREKESTALQLNLYAYLASQNGLELPETLGYTVFNKGTGSIQDLTWDFSEAKMYEALDSLIEYSHILTSTTYPKNLNSCIQGANKCAYFSKCHGGNNDQTSN